MIKTELLALISKGESSKLEFKKDDNFRPDVVAREIVAFANMNGGQILIGVDDNRDISGIQSFTQEWLMDTIIGRYVEPQIIPDFEIIEIDKKKVAVITIPTGIAKPYVLNHNDRKDIYLRYGNICKLADREQQIRLFDSGGLLYTDKLPIQGSSFSDLDLRRLRNYFVDVTKLYSLEEWEKFDEKDIIDLLIKRDLMKLNENQLSANCTISGMVLFGKNPTRKLPQSAIRITFFKGEDKSYDIALDKDIFAPFVSLKQDSYIDPSVPEIIIEILQRHLSTEKLEGVYRRRSWDYPPDGIRELIVNIFAHRDWTKNNDTRIEVYSNRMELISPGALPNGMTIDKIKSGQQTIRNNNIVRILRDYALMEHQGMGIRRTVIPTMLKNNGVEPDFEATEDYFKVVLRKGT